MPRPSSLVFGLLLALLPGCLVAAPRLSVEVGSGTVRAETESRAADVARILEDLTPRVRRLLPDAREEPVEVWVQSRLAIYSHWKVDPNVPAFTVENERRIHLSETSSRMSSAAMGHELVHALLGSSWDTLPAVAEEGLADWVQESLHPDLAASMRADHLSKAAAAFDGLDLGLWCTLPGTRGPQQVALFTFLGREEGVAPLGPPSEAIAGGGGSTDSVFQPYQVSVSDPRLYGVGYLLVARIIERHGMEGLHQLCVEAAQEGLDEVPAERLLAAAALDDDPVRWRSAVVERFGRTEVIALGHSLVPFLVDLVAEQIRPLVGADSGDEFLYRYRPRFGPHGTNVNVPLWGLPDLQRELREAWPQDAVRRLALAAR